MKERVETEQNPGDSQLKEVKNCGQARCLGKARVHAYYL